MDGNTAGVFAWFAFLLFIALMVLAVWAWVIVALARPNWLLPLLHRPQAPAQPQTIAQGTPWPAADYQLGGTFEEAASLVDPNTRVGDLIDQYLDHHYRDGNIVVTVPERAGVRQIGTSIRPVVRYE
jgi:hypothetical protein